MSEIVFDRDVSDLVQLQIFAEDLKATLPRQCVVALSGPMAAGKTELVKRICKSLGILDVSSPTFALHHHYDLVDFSVEHWDLFRIESDKELDAAGFWDLFSSVDDCIIFIEWPEKMKIDQIPRSWPLYQIEFTVNKSHRSAKVSRNLSPT